MNRWSNKIFWALLTGLLLVVWPQGGSAQGLDARALMRAQQNGQSGALYGGNPYENMNGEEGEGQQQQDTTKKERKIRKPLESYFFDDSTRARPNFMWHISRDYNRVQLHDIDTTLADYRIDYPFYRHGVGDMAQGGLGQTSQPLNYFDRPQEFNFTFATPYYAYLYDMENVPFYNTKKPMIRLSYLESGQMK